MADDKQAAGAPPPESSALTKLLDGALAAFRVGNFAAARKWLARAAAEQGSAAEQERRAALQERLRPDPLAAILIVLCLILFVGVIVAARR